MMKHFFANPDGEFVMSKRTFMMDFDFTTNFAVGFDPLCLEEHFK